MYEGSIASIKAQLEKSYRTKLADFDVRFSDNVSKACVLHPVETRKMSYVERRDLVAERLKQLRFIARGLKEHETDNIDHSKLTIFLPKKNMSSLPRLYGDFWEEVYHGVAHASGIVNQFASEGLALAGRFKGLLQEAKNGRFSVEKAIEQMETTVKTAYEFPYTLYPRLYDRGLDYLRIYNPGLDFKGRDPDEIMKELDKSIKYILSYWEKVRVTLRNAANRIKCASRGSRGSVLSRQRES